MVDLCLQKSIYILMHHMIKIDQWKLPLGGVDQPSINID